MNQRDKKILHFMQRRIRLLYPSKTALARLRRSVGKEFGAMPEVFEYVLPEQPFCEYEQQETQIELALYTALTLYAVHQQGKDTCVSKGLDDSDDATCNKNTFGHAIQRLSEASSNPKGVIRRLNQIMTSNDLIELSIHARGLISLLKQNNIPLDYPLLAVDLYHFQQTEMRKKVILSWGKDYYMHKREEENNEE